MAISIGSEGDSAFAIDKLLNAVTLSAILSQNRDNKLPSWIDLDEK